MPNLNDRKEKVSEAIQKVVKTFKDGNIEAIAYATFKSKNGRPSDTWSFTNRLLMLLGGTEDARGFRQWKEVKRHVNKGAKALYILVPMSITKPVEKINADGEVTTEDKHIVYFKSAPVFKYEDTGGAALVKDDFNLEIPGDLRSVADGLNISIEAKGFNGVEFGTFSNVHNEIELMSPDIGVYLHELSHAADNEINGKLKGGQHADQEIVAELSASVIAYLRGYELNGRSKEYIEHYANASWKTVFGVLGRVNRVVGYIVDKAAEGANTPS